jgi:hypothetical protein
LLGCAALTAALTGRDAAAQEGGATGRRTAPATQDAIARAAVAPDSASAPSPGRANSRVRALGNVAGRLLEQAIQKSPSMAAMVDELERSDLLVYVETRNLPKLVHGYVQMAGSTANVRYVRLVLGVPNTNRELMATLGHELRHTLEIAAMPDVRDGASLSARYRTLGVPMVKGGYYETEAALEAGRQVAREIALRQHTRLAGPHHDVR